MNKEYEINGDIRLKEPYKGWYVGRITGFYGTKIEITLTNGKELEVSEDEIEYM